ncbi:hypothetical protein HanRHA438_Chr09g0411751 [Helianthus annuus]|nr:hypothetical protein HanRHA438_Chr09g0411751 [Helianthus annuus]
MYDLSKPASVPSSPFFFFFKSTDCDPDDPDLLELVPVTVSLPSAFCSDKLMSFPL